MSPEIWRQNFPAATALRFKISLEQQICQYLQQQYMQKLWTSDSVPEREESLDVSYVLTAEDRFQTGRTPVSMPAKPSHTCKSTEGAFTAEVQGS